MRSQVGWPALREHLRREAPRYAQYLPSLPRLVHQALEHTASARDRELQRQLLAEQRRTNMLLQGLVGFGLGVLAVLLVIALWDLRPF
jgi:ubiquinone biosynthesis protein